MFGTLGFTEILLIVIAIIVLFGAKKIPEFAKGIGSGIKEFRNSIKDIEKDINLEDSKLKNILK
ncbi:MAG: twin-arginine translocase TatA/TatE family subunit [Bacteroidetes bacterium]|nr:twin-arginine translocase TatA/TatE family subunit [Bacteroidota bacterium]